MKITEQTTLAELAIERARLGITELHIKIGTDGNRVVSGLSPTMGAQCSGKTEAEAIDKVFRRIEHGVHVPPNEYPPKDKP